MNSGEQIHNRRGAASPRGKQRDASVGIDRVERLDVLRDLRREGSQVLTEVLEERR